MTEPTSSTKPTGYVHRTTSEPIELTLAVVVHGVIERSATLPTPPVPAEVHAGMLAEAVARGTLLRVGINGHIADVLAAPGDLAEYRQRLQAALDPGERL